MRSGSLGSTAICPTFGGLPCAWATPGSAIKRTIATSSRTGLVLATRVLEERLLHDRGLAAIFEIHLGEIEATDVPVDDLDQTLEERCLVALGEIDRDHDPLMQA